MDGLKLRELRRAHKLTGIEFAKMVGVGNNYVSQIENGVRQPSYRLLERMARVLKVSPSDLCEPADAPPDIDPRERILKAVFEILDEEGKAELLSIAGRLAAKHGKSTA